jgi:GNAT superfamily N-acetyltransferase
METVTVRLAKPDELEVMTDLALKSKASWGYSEDFMAACRAELTMTAAKLASWTVWVAETDHTVRGMIALNLGFNDGNAELEDFFVDPDFQGRGAGRALMSRLLETCRGRGVKCVGLDADPNAEPIYQRFGFVTVGLAPSRSIAGRMLPRMELDIDSIV